jgi:hypothetical protein
MTLIEEALKSARCIISVMGDHAGEGTDAIFIRKIADIKQTGITFWLMRSPTEYVNENETLTSIN